MTQAIFSAGSRKRGAPRRVAGSRRDGGFTLVEALVVVLLVGLIALAGSLAFADTWARNRLDTTAVEIRSFVQQARTRALDESRPVYLELSGRSLLLVVQDCGVSGWNDRRVLDRYDLPAFVSLSRSDVNGVDCSWPAVSGVPTLGCDLMGRTMDPSACAFETQVTAPQTLVITHRDMVRGTLTPPVTFTLTVLPLWQPLLERTIS